MLGSMESTSDPCCGPTNSATLLFPVSLIPSKSKSNPINLCGNSTSAVSHTSSNDFLQTLVLAPRQRRKTAASAKNSSCFFLSLLNHTVCLSVSLPGGWELQQTKGQPTGVCTFLICSLCGPQLLRVSVSFCLSSHSHWLAGHLQTCFNMPVDNGVGKLVLCCGVQVLGVYVEALSALSTAPSSFSAHEQLTIITHCWPRQTVVAQAHWTPLCADKQNQAEPTGCERPALPAPQLQPLLRDHPLRSTIAPQIPPLPHKVLVQVSV